MAMNTPYLISTQVAALTCEPVDLTMNVEEGLRPVLLGDDDWAAWFAAPRKVSGELN